MSNSFFHKYLQQADSRIAPPVSPAKYLLDKNEQSDDVDLAVKQRVATALLDADWNRYPAADLRDVEANVAAYCGLEPEHIALSAGSASMITTLLNYFALNRKRIVLTQPSYSLFDYHCKTYNIPYECWTLTADLEYDYDNMPALGRDTVLFITSPNNPVGNTIDYTRLKRLLTRHPDTLFVLDAVYCEFGTTDPTPLVRQFPNLIVLRSFSKAFPIAGLRLGYLCATPQLAQIIKKLVLPFSLNHFTLIFAREVLFQPEFMKDAQNRVREIIRERERMYRIIQHRYGNKAVRVHRSEGNFLLIRVHDKAAFEQLMADMSQKSIKVLNTAAIPQLHHTFRVSIGTPYENDLFLYCLQASLSKSLQPNRVLFKANQVNAGVFPVSRHLPARHIPSAQH